MVKLAQKSGKHEYIDYYGRQGFSIQDNTIKECFTALRLEEVYDIFDLLDKILFRKQKMNQTIYCLYNRSRFIIRFF
jgi:hypothetical protein